MTNKKGFSTVKIVLIGLLVPVLILVAAAWAYQASLSSAPQPLLHSAILTSATSTPSQISNSSTWQIYNDNSGNFSILYPNEYQVQQLNSQPNAGQTEVYLGSSTTVPLLAISYLPASATSTPQTVLNITKSNLNALEKQNSSISYTTGTTTVAGFPAQAIFASGTGSEDGAQYIFQAQGTIYTMSVLYNANSPQKTVDDNKALAANIIATFKVVPPLTMASDTSWQSYSNSDFNISFQYPPGYWVHSIILNKVSSINIRPKDQPESELGDFVTIWVTPEIPNIQSDIAVAVQGAQAQGYSVTSNATSLSGYSAEKILMSKPNRNASDYIFNTNQHGIVININYDDEYTTSTPTSEEAAKEALINQVLASLVIKE